MDNGQSVHKTLILYGFNLRLARKMAADDYTLKPIKTMPAPVGS